MKILLLEDDIALNKAIVKVLKLDYQTVTSYNDGQDVLNAINTTYDLYILDINVPNINGLELLKLIYENNNQSKIIMISSNTDMSSLQSAYEFGCVDYIKKPFHLEELRLKINRLNIRTESMLSKFKLKDKNDSLTNKEKRLLMLLLDNCERTVTYDMIEEYVYENKEMTLDALRTLVKRLRFKLADNVIQNVLNEGYRMCQLDNKLDNNEYSRILELEIENHKLKLEKQKLQKASLTDPLTGLYNRAKIKENFKSEHSILHGKDLSIIIMDIDDFKSINDNYGHNAGDQLLKEIAQLLTSSFRKTDTIIRWGGEEFLILLPNTDTNTTQKLTLQLRDTISSMNFIGTVTRTASFGIATIIENESLDSAIIRADEALYLAKNNGKNRVEVANSLDSITC